MKKVMSYLSDIFDILFYCCVIYIAGLLFTLGAIKAISWHVPESSQQIKEK